MTNHNLCGNIADDRRITLEQISVQIENAFDVSTRAFPKDEQEAIEVLKKAVSASVLDLQNFWKEKRDEHYKIHGPGSKNAMKLKVAATQCKTCIYRKDSPLGLDIKMLEAEIADPRMAGHFKGHRICHSFQDETGTCCRGFWNQHKDHFTAGQIAQRLGLVELVAAPVHS